MIELARRKCSPCEGGVSPYSAQQAKDMLKQLKGWILEDGKLVKVYPFANYCRVEYSTHAIDGLTENDFICAAKADGLFHL